MGAKGKYNEDTIKVIVDAIEKHGTHKDAFKIAQIAETTFYRWLDEKKEFKARVAKAEKVFRLRHSEELEKKVEGRIERLATEGAIEHWDVTETVTDDKGNLISTKQINRTIKKPCIWAMERMKGKPLHELEAVMLLKEKGWLNPRVAFEIQELTEKYHAELKKLLNGNFE